MFNLANICNIVNICYILDIFILGFLGFLHIYRHIMRSIQDEMRDKNLINKIKFYLAFKYTL